MKSLSIIIVTYNSQPLIEKCLDNLFLQNDIDDALEVIIVDNSNADVSAKMFNFIETKYPGKINLIKNDRNGGYGQGNNLGVFHAKGKHIAIMNPDITMTEPLFKNALQYFENNKNLGLLGYKQYGGQNLSFYFRQEFYFPILISILTKVLNRLNVFSSKYMFLSGAYLFAEKESFEEIGSFDENLFLYCEESDIIKRMLVANLEVKFDGSKSYIHEIDGRSQISNAGFKILFDSTMYYLDKFSLNKKKYLSRLLFDLKFKRIVYQLINNKETVNAVNNQINHIKLNKTKS